MKIRNISEILEGDRPTAQNDNFEMALLIRRHDLLDRTKALADKVISDAKRHGVTIIDHFSTGLPQSFNPDF